MYNTIKVSNKKIQRLSRTSYEWKRLASIPEDPLYWTDSDCYAFDDAIGNINFFIKDNDNFVLVETFDVYEDTKDIPQDGEPVNGNRELLIFYRYVWDDINNKRLLDE